MATLRLYQRFEAIIDGAPVAGGDQHIPEEIVTVGDGFVDNRKTLAEGSSWTAWTAGSGDALTSFAFLWIESDLDDVHVELTCDANNGVGRGQFVVNLKADKPFVLCTNSSLANYTANFATGTADVIDTIRIQNPTGTLASANVRVFLA